MPYAIADESFPTKEMLTERCRAILAATPDGQSVAESVAPFLFDLFQYHDEWAQKASGGVRDISAQTTIHGTRCFVLRKRDGSQLDISFPHAIRQIPSSRTTSLLPQPLRDFRNAARNAVRIQIYTFRDRQIAESLECPITGESLNRENCAVDHIPPNTFDQTLFDFCRARQINPLNVAVGSEGGTVAVIENQALLADWQSFHQNRANLRLISKLGNLQLPKTSVAWSQLWS
jgi:uncharacterized protein DUF3223